MSKKKAKVVPVDVQKTPEPTVEPKQAPEKAPETDPNPVPEVENDDLQSAVADANEQMEKKGREVPEQSTDGFDAYGEPSIDAPAKELHPVQKEADIK